MTDIDSRVSLIVKAGDDKKAFNIKVLEISEITSIADYFVIFSGNSDRQVKSIADEIEEKMTKAGHRTYHREGYNTGRWVLLDYGDIIAHVFHKEDREFYNLERLWVDGTDLDIDNII